MSRLVFTEKLSKAAATSRPYSAPLLHKWARLVDERGNELREQIERAASLVPKPKRRNVLGPLLAKSTSDDQVRATVGSLLLAKTLTDHGWFVVFEPEEAGGTPDFRINKGEATFVVEVRRVSDRKTNTSDRDIERIRDVLDGIETRTPISIRGAHLGGGASLKPFVRYVKKLFDSDPSPGPQTFHKGDVFVRFYVHKRFDEPCGAVISWSGGSIYGDQNDEVRSHINEKLGKYKIPLIIALDFFDLHDSFTSVEEVLLGREVIQIPVDLTGSGKTGEPRPDRANDGLLYHRGADGKRARERLLAVLAFGLHATEDGGFKVLARILGNPAVEEPLRLREFAPIPRLVVVEQTDTERRLRYLGENDKPISLKKLKRWHHVP